MNLLTKKICSFTFGLIFLFSYASAAVAAFVAPQYTGFVNDYAGLLTVSQRADLEQKLSAYKDETSTEIAVVITKDFQGLDAFTYSQKLFDTWKVGTASKDNGIIIAIGPKLGQSFPDHGDIFINNGRGVEGALPDILTGRIIRNDMVPLFKAGNIYGAVSAGIASIQLALKGEYTAEDPIGSANNVVNFVWYIGMFFLFFSSYFVSFLSRSKSWYAGGILGGLGGFFFGYFFFALTFAFAASAFFAIVGFILDYFLSKTYQSRLAKGLPTDFWHTRGGFWGSGRGGFGGGGFGGFGGGMSGGGGAGGGW